MLPLLTVVAAYPPGYLGYLKDFPEARNFADITLFQTVKGMFSPDAANSLTVEGAVEFTQNLFTGSNTQYTIWLRGDNMEGKNYQLGLSTDPLCDNMVSFENLNGRIMAPIFMINGFYVKGQSLSYNVGGTNGRKDLKNYYLGVEDAAGNVVGCTANMLI